jgi:hypothetical protein
LLKTFCLWDIPREVDRRGFIIWSAGGALLMAVFSGGYLTATFTAAGDGHGGSPIAAE